MVNKELEVVQEKVSGMQTMVEETKVENEKQLGEVSDKIKTVKQMGKFIKQEMGKFIDPAKEIITATKEKYDPFLNQCKEAEDKLKKKAEVFMVAEEKRIEDEKEKIADKVETGYIKPETAVDKMEEVGEVEKTKKTANSAISMKKIKTPGNIDESLVPDEYWIPRTLDMVKIGKVIRAGVTIPGVEVIEKSSIASR